MRYDELPPLAFLPALEAAGRLGSFKAAARELHITPSAVGQQIKAVEAALGVELFERRNRNILLRAEGAAYLNDVRQALRDLLYAGMRVRGNTKRAVRISTAPFIVHEFLLPRLSQLQGRFPSIELQLESSMDQVDLSSSEADAALRMGAGPWPGVVTRPLGEVVVTLVCAPALARKLRKPSDILEHPLLEIRKLKDRAIANFLKAAGLQVDPSQIKTFETYFETVRAAEHGLGLAIGLFPLTTHWVTTGRLAVPFPQRTTLPNFISLVHRHGQEAALSLAALADWLAAQYAALPVLAEGRIVPRRPARALSGSYPKRRL
jgi:LysR family glycine cleavage system transcriptional activator